MRIATPALLIALVAACGGTRAPEPAPADDNSGEEAPLREPVPVQAPEARVRLIHAAVESRDQAVTLVSDGVSSQPASFEFSTESLTLPPGPHAISAQANGTELIGASFTLRDGSSTLIAYSTGDFPVALALAPDATTAAEPDTAQIRFFHAIVGQGALDVCTPPVVARGDGAPIQTNVASGALAASDGAYLTVPAGQELALQLRAQHTTPCHGRVIGTVHGFTPVSENNYTLVFVGRLGRRGMPPELLFCADPPAIDTSCATLAFDGH